MFRFAVIWLFAGLILAGCSVGLPFVGNAVSGSGRKVTRDYDMADFSSVAVGHAFQVEISRSDTFSTSITADDNMFDYIRVSKEGARLRIDLDPSFLYSFSSGALRAKITLPTLDGVSLSGATRATISGFKSTSDVAVNLSGASQLDGDMDAGNARFETSGASRAKLRGAGKTAAVNGSGASQIDLADWPVESASVSLSGGSSAAVNASSKLDYDLSGGSHLTYRGNPSVGRSSTSGGSSAARQ